MKKNTNHNNCSAILLGPKKDIQFKGELCQKYPKSVPRRIIFIYSFTGPMCIYKQKYRTTYRNTDCIN